MNFYFAFILFGLTMTMADHRSKRFLIFPPTSPTRIQLIAGIGLPVELQYESVTIGYVLKAEYYLPDNTTLLLHFLQDPFDPIVHSTGRRQRRDSLLASNKDESQLSQDPTKNERNDTADSASPNDHYEKYNVDAIEIEKGVTSNQVSGEDLDEDEEYSPADYGLTSPNDFSTARWTLFKGIEYMAERKGLAGRPCLLRSICESAHAPFSHNSGILGELMHIIMTPSSTKDAMNDHSQNEYLRAEELGRSGEPCDKIFRECTASVLDQFSGIYNTFENVMKMLG